MEFYVMNHAGEKEGPLTVEQIKGYLNMGHFQYSDMAWRDGEPDWKPLSEFAEFPQRTYRTPNYKGMTYNKGAVTKKKKKSSLPTIITLVVVLAVAGGVGWYFWDKKQKKLKEEAETAARDAAAKAEAARKAWTPQTLQELNDWYKEPSGENGATFFVQAADAIEVANNEKSSGSLPFFGKARLPSIGSPVQTSVKNIVGSFVEKNKKALDALAKGAQCEGSRYPIDLTKGSSTPLPHLSKVKQAAEFAALYVLDQAEDHQGANAGQGVLMALAAGRSLDNEPLLISQLTRAACQAVAVETLEQALNRVAVPEEILKKLQEAFGRAADTEAAGTGFNRGLVGERDFGMATFDQPQDQLLKGLYPGNTAPKIDAATQEKIFANLPDQRKYFEETINQLLEARKEAFPARIKADDSVGPRVNEAQSKGYVVTAMMVPSIARVSRAEAASVARLRLGQTAIALQQFYNSNGNKFPDALTELSPKFIGSVPNDPFDGQPLRYRKAGAGFLLYSIGPDLKDDGGVRRAGSDDVMFIVASVPKA